MTTVSLNAETFLKTFGLSLQNRIKDEPKLTSLLDWLYRKSTLEHSTDRNGVSLEYCILALKANRIYRLLNIANPSADKVRNAYDLVLDLILDRAFSRASVRRRRCSHSLCLACRLSRERVGSSKPKGVWSCLARRRVW